MLTFLDPDCYDVARTLIIERQILRIEEELGSAANLPAERHFAGEKKKKLF
jgi:hypothetical protein